MAVGRVHRRQLQTRAKLLESAHRIMSDRGVDDTTIQQITAEADVGFGTFYSYFESKDEIAVQVLDCVIHNLGLRNQQANIDSEVTDPVAVISNSVRLTAHEMMTNPMWRWWLKRTDLMVRRMNRGFRPFGIEDMGMANEAGYLNLPGDDVDCGWSYLIWLLAGTITEIVEGLCPPASEARMAEAILRVLGVDAQQAAVVANADLPKYPDLPVDYKFSLDVSQMELVVS